MEKGTTLEFENARIIFKNFEGRKDRFNVNGTRNFSIALDDPDIAHQLMNDGWPVKTIAPKEEGDSEFYYMSVNVKFDPIPPAIYMVTKRKKTQLGPDTVGMLDSARLKSCDIQVRPYQWEVNGKTGIKPYLSVLYAVLEEDVFADKYASLEYPEE